MNKSNTLLTEHFHFDPLSSGQDSKCRSEKDDGFVRVTFKTEKGEQHSHIYYIFKYIFSLIMTQ